MANGVYNIFLENTMNGGVNWAGSIWSAAYLTNAYTPSFTGDTVFTNFSFAILASSPTVMAGLSISSAGVLSANSVVMTGVAASLSAYAIIVYNNVGAGFPAFYFNTPSSLQFTTNGASITIDWNATLTSGILYTP